MLKILARGFQYGKRSRKNGTGRIREGSLNKGPRTQWMTTAIIRMLEKTRQRRSGRGKLRS